jgi:cytochrome c-type biogenesis protein
MTLGTLVQDFLLGVATPLSAACVIPLYPAFIAYLASTGDEDGGSHSPLLLGVLVVAGVIGFMALVGVVFTLVLEESIGRVVTDVSPIAFVLLAVVGAVLLVDPKGFSRLPSFEPPQTRYPSATAFAYGFFFGAIVIPCNPGTIALFFARSPVLYDTHIESMLGFLAFGLGIGAPLLAFATFSESFGRRVTSVLARYSNPINRAVGAVLLGVSVYYLATAPEVVSLPI